MSHHGRPPNKRQRQSDESIHSIRSASTHPPPEHANLDSQMQLDAADMFARGHFNVAEPQQEHLRTLRPAPQEALQGSLMLRGQAMKPHDERDFMMDAMDMSMSQSMPMPSHSQMSRPSMPPQESFSRHNSMARQDSILAEQDDMDNVSIDGSQKLNGGSRLGANNDLEMRKLYQQNRSRSLQEVAEELHGNERGPRSERTRQVFAMLWISSVCEQGKGSVPRGRVYANYAARCAVDKITVLNPASFGKLVRVLFPGLKTRRLGVRGESKYHYVNLTLKDEEPEPRHDLSNMSQDSMAGHVQNLNALPAQTISPISETSANNVAQPTNAPTMKHQEARHAVYHLSDVTTMDELSTSMTKTVQQMSLATDDAEHNHQGRALQLPPIEPFLPPYTDHDAAKSLSALYLSHCTSLVESMRFCKEAAFFHHFVSFQGTLTNPVMKLFTNPALAPWIEQCDCALYQQMMRILSALTLQVVPKVVLDTLRSISVKLVEHVRQTFRNLPAHVLRAKEAPAAMFSNLLDRLLRVNLTAHAAANMLSNPANRDQMYLDWITMVRIRKVAEVVPASAMDDVVMMLLTEMRDLLDPMDVPWDIESGTIQGDLALRKGILPQPSSGEDLGSANVLDKWVTFLTSIQNRFPTASPDAIVSCVQLVGSQVMRDITIAQGKSFGSWWVTKCWIDEMISFMAEKGGFMSQKSTTQSTPQLAQEVIAASAAPSAAPSAPPSRPTSVNPDFNMMPEIQDTHNTDQAPFPTVTIPGNASAQQQPQDAPPSPAVDNTHDDSGIGMPTPEEDFEAGKYGFAPTDSNQMVDTTVIQ